MKYSRGIKSVVDMVYMWLFYLFCLSPFVLGVLVKDICSTHMVVLPTNILFVNKKQANSKQDQTCVH